MRALVLEAELRAAVALSDAARLPASTVWADPALVEREVPEPRIAAPHDVIVSVACCGICGSDLHASQAGPDGHVLFGGSARLPVVLGHELAGTVLHAGSAVTHLAAGDVVTVESIWACWNCDECRGGYLNECRDGNLLGLTTDGGLAPLVRVDSRHCYSITSLVRRHGIDRAFELGALLEPLGVAYRGLVRAHFRADDRVVVVGVGPIGLATVMLARALGATQIAAFDRNASRVALAAAAGARAFVAEDGTLDHALSEAFDGERATLAVEAGGTPGAFDSAFASLGNRGRLLVLGRMPANVALDTNTLLSKALSVIGSRGHAGAGIFRTLIDRLADGSFDPSTIITGRFGFSQLQEAFAYARLGDGGKTLIRVAE